jgi:uncharacterized protein YecT (DUF1311 family)
MRRKIFVRLLAALALALTAAPLGAQACQDHADLTQAEACLVDQVEALRIEVEESFAQYVELLPTLDARDAQIGQDRWERYLEDECRDAGDRYQGGAFVLVEILSCQEWGARRRALQLRLLRAALHGGSFVFDPTCFVPTSDVVVLTGWVAGRRESDNETITVINLDQPLCTDVGDGPQQVTALQLVGLPPGLGRRARRFLGARVSVEGRLFLPHLSFHRTPLVMVVQGLEPAG